MLVEFILALFFLILNALFVLVEFAIVRSRATKFEELSQKGNPFAKAALEITSNLNSYLAAIQLGITIASIGLGWIAQPFVVKLLKHLLYKTDNNFLIYYSYSISITLSFMLVTSSHIIIGEQVPKYIAISLSEKITMLFAFPLKLFYKITYYPMLFINKTSELIVKSIGVKKSDEHNMHSEDEIKLILSRSEEAGKITLSRLMFFEHIFDFGKGKVKEISVPVEKIISLDLNTTYSYFLNIFSKYKFSRYPVISQDKFIGFIHIKDLLGLCLNENSFDIKKVMREIKVINENLDLERALRYFQENNIHIALTCDEKNKITGMLSIEDIIEEITGEIRDEFEKKPVNRLNIIFDKKSSIMNVNSSDRFEVISMLVEELAKNGRIKNKDEIKQKVIKREKSFSTAVGHHFAIPHARIQEIVQPVITIARREEGINFITPDNKPVKIVFLILTPYNDPSIQLNILSKISKIISNTTLRKKILNAKTLDKIEEIFNIFEDNVPED